MFIVQWELVKINFEQKNKNRKAYKLFFSSFFSFVFLFQDVSSARISPTQSQKKTENSFLMFFKINWHFHALSKILFRLKVAKSFYLWEFFSLLKKTSKEFYFCCNCKFHFISHDTQKFITLDSRLCKSIELWSLNTIKIEKLQYLGITQLLTLRASCVWGFRISFSAQINSRSALRVL